MTTIRTASLAQIATLAFSFASAASHAETSADTPDKNAAETPTAVSPAILLTPPGKLVVEPSLQYVNSTATEVAIEGFTVIPAVAIGMINVSQIQRDALTAAVLMRYGLPKGEIEFRFPYVYRAESIRERQVLEKSQLDIIRDSSGSGVGDVEVGMHYQFATPLSWPLMLGNLRLKTATGDGPFEVPRKVLYDENGTPLGEVLEKQPTGSGFYAIQPSFTMIIPNDPAVLHATVNYLWNLKRDVGHGLGTVDPGDAVGFNIGIGLAINQLTSLSFGYDHSIVFKTKIENDNGVAPSFARLQVGTLLLGLSYRLSSTRNINVNLGVGITDFAPDVQLTLRLPFMLSN